MEYQIVKAMDAASLTSAVRYWISKGWKPLGGVANHTTQYSSVFLIQAMIKED